MIPANERPRSTLRAVVAYAKHRGHWPNGDDLHRYRPRLGSRATVHRALHVLLNAGLISFHDRGSASHWAATEQGFDFLHRPPFRPHLEALSTQRAAANILDATIRSSASIAPPAVIAALSASLEIME